MRDPHFGPTTEVIAIEKVQQLEGHSDGSTHSGGAIRDLGIGLWQQIYVRSD